MMHKSLLSIVFCLAIFSPQSSSTINEYQVDPLLAVSYEKGKITDWENQLFSEKLDGVRAIWTGSTLVSKKGIQISAPDWFIQNLPDYPVEGELWAGRGEFEQVLSTVMDDVADHQEWKSIRFMIFDLPAHSGDFVTRYQAQISLINQINVFHIQYVRHFEALTETHVMANLDKVVEGGGEGLILRDKKAVYHAGRDPGVVKLKITDDAEAKLIGYVEGKGKYQGQMGSVIVEMPNGINFKIGSGFTDQQRLDPPKIGTQITYRHNGFTKNGIPKFARFWRVDTSK